MILHLVVRRKSGCVTIVGGSSVIRSAAESEDRRELGEENKRKREEGIEEVQS